MIKLKLLIVCIFLLGIRGVYSQNKIDNLYLIASNPEMHLESETYLSFIYKCQNDSLIVVDTLTTGAKMCPQFVRVYHEKRTIYFYEEDILGGERKSFKIISMNGSLQDVKLENFNTRINPWPNLISTKDEDIFVLYEELLTDTIKFYGVKNNLETVSISPSDFNNVYLVGNPGAPLKKDDYFLLSTNENSGVLNIPVTKTISSRPVFKLTIPLKYLPVRKKRIVVYVNTEKILALKLFQENGGVDNIGESLYLIYNKLTYEWSELKVSGNKTRIQAFGRWISGSIVSNSFQGEKNSTIPEMGKKLPDIYGPRFDVMIRTLGLYYPGSLFIYNIDTEDYIEWNTGQGDSEVLFVNEKIIFYRVDDSIFKASVELKTIGLPKLLLKDCRVRDIHWAFFNKE